SNHHHTNNPNLQLFNRSGGRVEQRRITIRTSDSKCKWHSFVNAQNVQTTTIHRSVAIAIFTEKNGPIFRLYSTNYFKIRFFRVSRLQTLRASKANGLPPPANRIVPEFTDQAFYESPIYHQTSTCGRIFLPLSNLPSNNQPTFNAPQTSRLSPPLPTTFCEARAHSFRNRTAPVSVFDRITGIEPRLFRHMKYQTSPDVF
uniref:hypothetical protein n=1 Tax=Bifidobacterium bombi TaxID=471511 RepID=UPI000AA3B93E